jgi:signal transduction histidine kinase
VSISRKFLSGDDIARMVPHALIDLAIRELKKSQNLFIGVMFDKDEENPELSEGTGKYCIVDPKARTSYCKFLRQHPDKAVNRRCVECSLADFHNTKNKVISNPNYRGETYVCAAGGLLRFTIPILEPEENSFIGVIFGGQDRPKESKSEAKDRLRKFIDLPANESLRAIPFRKLFKEFHNVKKVTAEEFETEKCSVETIARDIADNFGLFIRNKKAELETKLRQDTTNKIYEILIVSQDFKSLGTTMFSILEILKEWLHFDWGIVLGKNPSPTGMTEFRITAVNGRGLGPLERIKSRLVTFSTDALHAAEKPTRNPEFLLDSIASMISGQPEFWWIPIWSADRSVFSGIILGSAPKHHNTTYNPEHIKGSMHYLELIVRVLATHCDNLLSRREEELRSKELEKKEREARETALKHEDDLITMTHQLLGPLSAIIGATSRSELREAKGQVKEIVEYVQALGEDAISLCYGTSTILAAKAGRKTAFEVHDIEAPTELHELCMRLQKTNSRPDLEFRYHMNDGFPILRIDKDVFTSVMYSLIHNALKYARSDSTVTLVCGFERSTGKPALKVKSIGVPIQYHERERIFQKFKKGHLISKTGRHHQGIGLGLWVARELMREIGGDLTIELSPDDPELSVFVVHFPWENSGKKK